MSFGAKVIVMGLVVIVLMLAAIASIWFTGGGPPKGDYVAGAQKAVEQYLRVAPIGTLPTGLGSFEGLIGSGYLHPEWGFNRAALHCHRTATFSTGSIPLLIRVELPPGGTDPAALEWQVMAVGMPTAPGNPELLLCVGTRPSDGR